MLKFKESFCIVHDNYAEIFCVIWYNRNMENEKNSVTEIELLRQENSELKGEVEQLRQQLGIMKKMYFGQKSEKTEYISDGQLNLFNEAEKEEDATDKKSVEVAKHSRKPKRTHEEFAEGLETEEVVHSVPEEERVCDTCGSEMQTVGKEFVRDELVYIPARVFVRKHYVEVLKCIRCGTSEQRDAENNDIEKQSFRKAAVPKPLFPNSFCSPELLAHIIYDKYVNGMPLYRQETALREKGITLSRATMANWIIRAAREQFKTVYDEQKRKLLTYRVIHADETVVQVLKEPGKKAKTDSRMWVYSQGEPEKESIVLFEYQPTRSGDHAKKFLGDFNGYLVTDGYVGYNKLTNVTRCGCWAHMRRKFAEALPAESEAAKASMAAQGIKYIDRLFTLERDCDSDVKRAETRENESKITVEEFYTWLGTFTAAGAGLTNAVGYALSQKKALTAFLDAPCVPISNNRAENAIRPFCVGRKNWLFADTVRGAEASAIIYSLVATAKANNLNPEAYFTRLLSGNLTP